MSKYLKALRDRHTLRTLTGLTREVMGQKGGRKFMQQEYFLAARGVGFWFFFFLSFCRNLSKSHGAYSFGPLQPDRTREAGVCSSKECSSQRDCHHRPGTWAGGALAWLWAAFPDVDGKLLPLCVAEQLCTAKSPELIICLLWI